MVKYYEMIYPPLLKNGDAVAIVSPSGIINQAYIDNAIYLLEKQGLKVYVGKHANGNYHFFSGTIDERLEDINNAIEDDNIKAIFCARGGYGAIHLIEGVNWSKFVSRPKWLIGFSDVTVLHAKLNQINIASIHGPMPKTFPLDGQDDGGSFDWLMKMLSKYPEQFQTGAHPLNNHGKATGVLIGGNLSILYSLLATPYCFDPTDKILFIEDLCEQYYHLDRMMNSLKHSGFLSKLKAVVVGQFSDMNDSTPSYGQNAYEIINQYVTPLKIPVAFNFPIGHTTVNYPFIVGAKVTLDVSTQTTLNYKYGKT